MGRMPKKLVGFPERLQYVRERHGLSREELATAMDISRETVRLWENGESSPTLDSLEALARYFNMPLAELVDPAAAGATEEGLKAAEGMLAQLTPALAAIREAIQAAQKKGE
jgi:transcriptional regulator with XRE-family HTH domain